MVWDGVKDAVKKTDKCSTNAESKSRRQPANSAGFTLKMTVKMLHSCVNSISLKHLFYRHQQVLISYQIWLMIDLVSPSSPSLLNNGYNRCNKSYCNIIIHTASHMTNKTVKKTINNNKSTQRMQTLPRPKSDPTLNLDFQINPDPDACQIAPIMYWIHCFVAWIIAPSIVKITWWLYEKC